MVRIGVGDAIDGTPAHVYWLAFTFVSAPDPAPKPPLPRTYLAPPALVFAAGDIQLSQEPPPTPKPRSHRQKDRFGAA